MSQMLGPHAYPDTRHVFVNEPGLTARQVAWAAQHDWYVSENGNARPDGGGIVTVVERASLNGKALPGAYRTFCNFKKLRAWAGY